MYDALNMAVFVQYKTYKNLFSISLRCSAEKKLFIKKK